MYLRNRGSGMDMLMAAAWEWKAGYTLLQLWELDGRNVGICMGGNELRSHDLNGTSTFLKQDRKK